MGIIVSMSRNYLRFGRLSLGLARRSHFPTSVVPCPSDLGWIHHWDPYSSQLFQICNGLGRFITFIWLVRSPVPIESNAKQTLDTTRYLKQPTTHVSIQRVTRNAEGYKAVCPIWHSTTSNPLPKSLLQHRTIEVVQIIRDRQQVIPDGHWLKWTIKHVLGTSPAVEFGRLGVW